MGALDAPLEALLTRNGHPSPREVADVMRDYPMQQMAMMRTLHRERGNSFVQQVIAEMELREPEKKASSQLGPMASGIAALPVGSVFAEPKDPETIIANSTRYGDVADQQMASFLPVLAGYGRARDALDKEGVKQLGTSVLAMLEITQAALEGMDDQLKLYKAPLVSEAGAPAKDEMAQVAQAERLEGLRARRDQLKAAMVPLQLNAVTTMAPLTYRGAPIPDVTAPVVAPVANERFDVREKVGEELVRTLTIIHASERLFTQFAKPGALQDRSKQLAARLEIQQFAHRPLDLAFLRAVLSGAGLWQALNSEDDATDRPGIPRPKADPFALEVCKDEGPLTSLYQETRKQAGRTGWGTDIGHYDDGLADLEIRIGSTEGVLSVYTQIMSAPPDGRAAILYDLKKQNRFESLFEKLPWAYTKDVFDGLPGGAVHAGLKQSLQKYFLIEGKWGTTFEFKENKPVSLTKTIRDIGQDIGGIGEDLVDGFDSALNFMTLGFTHSYGEASDLHNDGLITDEDYSASMRQIAVRTAVGMAIMMATAGYGRAAMGAGGAAAPTMMGMGAGRGIAQTALATGVEGATFATGEMFAMDTADLATGAKGQYSDITDYLKVAMLGGGLGAAVGGTTSWLSGRTAARYLPGEMMTRGQSLAAENPALAPVLDQLQGAARGSNVSVRVTAAQADALAEAGVIDAASHKLLRDALAGHGEVEATIEVVGDLNTALSGGKASGIDGPAGKSGAAPKAPDAPSLSVRNVGPANTPAGTTPTATPAVAPATLREGLPQNAVVEQTGGADGDGWVIYRDAGGAQRIRFRANQGKTLQEATPGRNMTPKTGAGVNTDGDAFVLEGRHRAIGAAKGETILPDRGGVAGQPGVLDYKYNPMQIDESGVYLKDQHIDQTGPDVSPAEAAFIYEQRHGFKPSAS